MIGRAELPPGTPGELWVRGDAQMREYLKKPDEPAATVTLDGWVKTGDMATLRADGHIRFVGRSKDMLKIGGENVSPAEVEARLQALPGVRDAAANGPANQSPKAGDADNSSSRVPT